MWPLSNTSSSGRTPSSCTRAAIVRSVATVFTITNSPPGAKFMLPQSSVQISGSSSTTCARRSSAPAMSVASGSGGSGSGDPSIRSPPIPQVRFTTTSTSAPRTRRTTSR